MSDSTPKLCLPPPLPPPQKEAGGGESFVASTKVWSLLEDKCDSVSGTLVLNVGFKDGNEIQQSHVQETLKVTAAGKPKDTWADFANIEFTFNRGKKDILVSFEDKTSSWSCVGTDSTIEISQGNHSVNFGWVPDSGSLTASQRATIVHEFGHAIGLMHEHQSPARGGFIHLKERAVYDRFLPLLNYSRKKVKSQVIDVYNSQDVAAFSQVDRYSIMMYPMEASLNEEGIDIDTNLHLSELDKAFVTLMYPPDLRQSEKRVEFIHWMEVAGIPDREKGVILHAFNEKVKENPTDVRPAVDAARQAFIDQNKVAMRRYRTNADILNQVQLDGPSKQSGIFDFLGNIIKSPIITGVVTNIAKEVFQQHSIQMYEPQFSENDVVQVVGRLINRPEIEDAVADSYRHLSGEELEKGEKEWYDRIKKASGETEKIEREK